MRVLVLLTDAFGGHGGIALYNRDFLTALCSHPACTEVVALPRLMTREAEPLPDKLTYVTAALGGKFAYVRTLLGLLTRDRRFDLIVCAHLNLLPLAFLAKKLVGAPLLLEIYGIDAWHPTNSIFANKLVEKIDGFVSISEITKIRFLGWAKLDEKNGHLLPNAIHLEQYGPGPKNPELLARYGLMGKTILMTLGRLASQERYKGFDEVLEVLPDLAADIPDVSYLIVGEGNDRQRLTSRAKALGIADRVVFTGYIPEKEKAEYYRLADVYLMPSTGEGFGFVFLEALACGVPVIGSTVDGSREALRNGLLGTLVEPGCPAELLAAVRGTLRATERRVPDGLAYFSYEKFKERLHEIVSRMIVSGHDAEARLPADADSMATRP